MNYINEHFLNVTSKTENDISNVVIEIVKITNKKFTITMLHNGYTLIKVNESSIPLIKQFISIYKEDLFSQEAINYIKRHFKLNGTKNPWQYIYVATDIKELNYKEILDSTQKISYKQLVEILKINKFSKFPFKHPDSNMIYFGTYLGDEIVSLTSGYIYESKAVELSAETLVKYRHKGFAKSNTLAIAKYLLNSGYHVYTTNGVYNTLSIKTVQSLGFKLYARQISFFEA